MARGENRYVICQSGSPVHRRRWVLDTATNKRITHTLSGQRIKTMAQAEYMQRVLRAIEILTRRLK
jgi:hypothetical protein